MGDGTIGYRLRIRASGVVVDESYPTMEAALIRRGEVLGAIAGGKRPPARPAPPPVVVLDDGLATVADEARRLVRGMTSGQLRNRDGHVYKPSVIRKYEAALRLLVLPEIGATPISRLDRRQVQALVNRVHAAHSPEHARRALTALRVVCRQALADDVMEQTPCTGVRVPRDRDGEERPARVLTPAETVLVLRAAAADDARLHRSLAVPLISLALATGQRLGELLGLTWGAEGLDLEAGIVSVRSSLDRVRGADGLYPRITPKSRSSVRNVPLDAGLSAVLRRHHAATGSPPDGVLVYRDKTGRQLVPQGSPYTTWRRIIVAAGIAEPRPRFHDLRHTFATHALASGSSAHAVARLLGHADAGLVWRRYGHALPAELAEAADRLRRWRDANDARIGP
jgi:integrase